MMRFYRLLFLSGLLLTAFIVKGQPIAVADNDESTLEDNPTTFSVTANDLDGLFPVDPATVDLNPSLLSPGIQSTFTSAEGDWSVNSTGDVTYMPALNFFGTASITYTVWDSNPIISLPSLPAQITVEVAPDNDSPTITGQLPVSTPEETARTIDLSDLTITDPDNPPADFSLDVADGANYTRTGNTITPNADYNGPLSVPVTVTDGDGGSDSYDLAITVTAVNTQPIIASQQTLTTPEETALTILVGNFTITDPDNDTHTLTVQDGVNYTRSGNTITPSTDFNGDLTVQVVVNDGTENSEAFNATVAVTPINDLPQITAQVTLTTPEETPLLIELNDLTIVDSDDTEFTLTVIGGLAGYSTSGNTITPNASFNGNITVPVAVNDGTANSPSFDLIISVTGVNNAPVVSAQATLNTPEETGLTLVLENFTITDVDNTTHTLTVQDGTNYTRTGNTITPALNFNGALTVPIIVNDGTVNSAVYNATVNVTPVNDAPAITGQNSLSTPENTALTILVENLTIVDPDNTTFTLTVADGTNYTRAGNIITPNADFNGALTVPVTVSDGTTNSPSFNLTVTVSNVNTAPVVASQVVLTTPEETALTLLVGNFTITDPDDATHTLSVQDGTNYTRVGNTITPILNFNGSLTVPVIVNDGTTSSEVFNTLVTVNPINDAPVITAQASLGTNEETSLTILVANLVVADPDNNSFTLTIQDGTNYSRSGNTITPDANFSGTLTVPATVNDGTVSSPVFNLSVTVSNVNNTPVVTAQVPLSTPEETALTLTIDNFTITDPDNTTFTLSVQDGTNYTRSGNTITPSLNFNGTLTVPVTVNDGTLTSGLFNANVVVTPVNDAPTITAQSPLSTVESTPLTIVVGNLTIMDVDNTTFTLSVQEGTNYTNAGNTITPDANFNGTLTIPVIVNDGEVNSEIFNVSVSVGSVNNAPVVTAQTPLTTPEETALTIILSNLTISDPDNTTFTFAVQNGTNYTNDGNKITPATNFNGILTVPVTVSDGTSTSAPFNLSVSVTPVNDPPVISANVPLTTPENTPITLTINDFTIQDADNEPNDFKLKILQGGFKLSGTTITPPENFDGEMSVSVTVNDGGLESPPYNFKIQVNNVNIAPVITGQNPDPIEVLKNNPLPLGPGSLIIEDKDDKNVTEFPISISSGAHYTISGTTIVPELDYVGPLNVIVTVSDGKDSSLPFTLKVNVIEKIEIPRINGQEALVTNEDTPLTLVLDDFKVTDPAYPKGYTMTILPGSDYTVNDLTITPSLNVNGIIKVGIQVSNGLTSPSPEFSAQVFVQPVNDAPQITAMESVSILYEPGSGPISITEIFEAEDVDNEFLNFAEIKIVDSMYSPQNDELIFENSEDSPIRAIYDPVQGILSMIGYASKQQYVEAIRSIKYNYRLTRDENGEQSPISITPKSVSINLSDGQLTSENRGRAIELETSVDLDIPNAFTPNGDVANNTWAVHPVTNSDQFDKTIVRVFNKRGLLIYEAVGLDKEWDGTFNGQELPADTYYYTIDLRLSFIKKTYKGAVTILR